MHLSDEEKAMRDGRDGPAVQKAMDLLMRYGEALGAERLVETRNVCASITSTTPFQRDFALAKGGGMDAVFSEFSLDSQETVEIPKFKVFTSHLQLGFDPGQPERMGVSEEIVQFYNRSERHAAGLGAQIMNTCTPYQVGNIPTRGEHCAWMESSAVVYCNSVLGARTNCEGGASTGAAGLTGKIPYWGNHLPENRYATRLVRAETPVASMQDWGLFGYFVGEAVQEERPAVTGRLGQPILDELKHFGAATATSGGVEMYHIPGITPEAPTLEAAFGGHRMPEAITYGAAERRAAYEALNSQGTSEDVDFILLGCPHASLTQLSDIARMLDGKRLHDGTELWIMTPRALRSVADRNGYTAVIEAAGGHLLTDSCPAMSRTAPEGTRVFATDSAKQAHYLPAILGIEAWFGTLEECISAAVTGRWRGELATA